MKIMHILLIGLLILGLSPDLMAAQEITFQAMLGGEFQPSVEEFKNGYIDWGNGYYYAVSKGYPPKAKRSRLKKKKVSTALQKQKAKVAAIEGAKAELIIMANKIRVDAEATVDDLIAAGYKIKLDGWVTNYEIVAQSWVDAPQRPYYEVLVRAPVHAISGSMIDSQITKLTTGKRGEIDEPPVPEPEPEAEPIEPVEPEEPAEPEEPKEKTKEEKLQDIKDKAGAAEAEMLLIIDAQGTDANPAMFPEIEDEDGADIFNITLPDKVNLKHKQMVKYVKGGKDKKKKEKLINELLKRKNILYVQALPPVETIVLRELPQIEFAQDDGAKPKRKRRRRFTAKASSSAGKLKANIVISKKDAEKIAAANKKDKFFEKANVYVIMDSSIGGTEGWLLLPLEELVSSL